MERNDYYFLKAGGIYVSREQTYIHTVLGSCISICISDPINFVGGMNHFIYHHAMENPRSCRYGDVAVPYLLKLLADMGGEPKNYIVHIVGGSKSLILGSRAGEENINIAKEILLKYKIPISKIDIGGEKFRKVVFNNFTGEIIIKKGDS